ncbi:succinylglutamate desuccinylase/aspartoacylase family protein [Conexibacter arvalis]|uniref:Succinylglutamate desuccinylase/Aspartoacylase catalytic domain-containing protein n=1 Tax=Conexibacter arvalis TaxID=912552 RepID=A0A840I902_9ACTN|nr:succinylglutamate desuccinylase/aspartoacylase family protein [Conexibacter arvalis]MBB4660588.1 hypothetical protein [Conexibacter arvalis]
MVEVSRIAPGSRVRARVAVGELLDGSPLEIPALVVRGRRPGPVLYVGAAIHGDEVVGIEAVRRACAALDPERLRGAVIAVPVQNPVAFRARGRLLPAATTDGYATDVHTAFPGDPAGDLAARIAHGLAARLIGQADYAIDLHAPLAGGVNLEYVFTPSPAADGRGAARELALAFGTRLAIVQERGPYVLSSMLHEACTRAGTPTFSVELAVNGVVDDDSAERGSRGIANVMRRLEMVEGAPEEPVDQLVTDTVVNVRVERGGLPELLCRPGDRVVAGQPLGVVRDLFFEQVERVVAPVDGLVYRVAAPRPLNGAERLAAIAVAGEERAA